MNGCPEFALLDSLTVSRRGLLRGLTAGGVATTVGSAVITASPASAAAAQSVLVVLSLRGAADGLSLVVPHADPAYYAARPTIAVPRTSLLATDAGFGLHPGLTPLLPMWNAGQVAAVHATGMAVPNRSHFEAMELVEDADPGSAARSGWLNRLVGLTSTGDPLQGLSIGSTTPTALVGSATVMSMDDLASTTVPGDASRRASLEAMWRDESSPMSRAMGATLAGVDRLGTARAQTDNVATYPSTDLGRALSSVARTLRADLGVQVVTVDQGDWDMHSDLGTLEWGGMQSNAAELGKALAAFFADLGPVRPKVTLVALSEFGRRVVQNSGYGLDHGWGNVMLTLGAGVRGGYYARWTPLAKTLDADVPVTTDYRDVLAEVVAARMPATSLATVFPGFVRTPIGFMTGQSGWGRTAPPQVRPPASPPASVPTTPAPVPTKHRHRKHKKRRHKRHRRHAGKR
ncbi:Uncharacterized conserved protein, DUF1501 family [Nocardioides terrae]|uniref:Uncharacterized conserved protein, DUF1501 family n=1 Tax=Nocardioides terrae TaxID=574651 RepID=A0A1I1HZD5_9ACTN|nr:DUF1501 domain-containing protein [Nocardioides terrae]SFC29437.1 Uncharacterized conserved protein, DUF1501 family [Nocardioides terrae]